MKTGRNFQDQPFHLLLCFQAVSLLSPTSSTADPTRSAYQLPVVPVVQSSAVCSVMHA